MIPTDHEYTVATHAAAKRAHDLAAARQPRSRSWEEENLATQRLWLEDVLPIVDAAISALPDRRFDAWTEIRALHGVDTFTADEIWQVLRGKSV